MADIGELYEQNAQAVYRYIRSRGFDEDTAADLMQETFLAAWRQQQRFEGASRPLTWLIGIARHKLADETRRRERERARPVPAGESAEDFAAFAKAYADQTEADHAAMVRAVKAGKLPIDTSADQK